VARAGGAGSRAPDLSPVVITHAEPSDGPLTRELKSLALPTLLWPAVSVTSADLGPLTAALAAVRSFGWIVFASRHAVAAVLERLPVAPEGVRVAAVGQATAPVLRQRGWPPALVPAEAGGAAARGEEDFEGLRPGAAAVAIGRTTAGELAARGHTAVVAESATLQGLARTTHRLLQMRA